MTEPGVVRIREWADTSAPEAVLDLVQAVATGPPYNYQPGEIAAAAEWFPALVATTDLTFLHYDDADRPIGYCLAVPLERHKSVQPVVAQLGVDVAHTLYIAELGVARGHRRRGVATRLLRAACLDRGDGIAAYVVRTLAGNQPAIAFYERHGFTVADGVCQVHRGRSRIFLIRREG